MIPQQGVRHPPLQAPTYQTNLRYHDRRTKARYVWEKYQPLVRGATILDVGADECHLRQHLDAQANYLGVGFGPGVDQCVDLEAGWLDFADRSFDCVLCCDVLEHLEAAHKIFDELCRIARRHVIISLPNSWAPFYQQLRGKGSRRGLKFYGLPQEPPSDRHRWFFSATEAAAFIRARAAANGWSVEQIDYGWPADRHWQRRMQWRRWLQRARLLPQVELADLYAGHVWAVLVRQDQEQRVA